MSSEILAANVSSWAVGDAQWSTPGETKPTRRWRPTCLTNTGSARKVNMLGWTILFAITPLGGMVVKLTGQPVPFWLKMASLVFAALFFLSLLTSAVGSRARC